MTSAMWGIISFLFGSKLLGQSALQLYGDYFISHEIRIPSLNNQEFVECILFFFFRGSSCGFDSDSEVHFFSTTSHRRLEGLEADGFKYKETQKYLYGNLRLPNATPVNKQGPNKVV